MRTFILCGVSLWVSSAMAYVSEVTVVTRRILSEVRSTSYTHTISIDERNRRYDVDCSGFAKFILDKSSRPAAEELEAVSTGKRPLAKDFVKVIEKDGRAWQSLNFVRNLKPGDLIAWLVPAGSTSKDTGHVMIVDAQPRRSKRFKNEYLISVIDASSSGHGKADPRRKAGPNGVGSGVIGLLVDANDRPTAFFWSGGESTEAKRTTIKMGRPR